MSVKKNCIRFFIALGVSCVLGATVDARVVVHKKRYKKSNVKKTAPQRKKYTQKKAVPAAHVSQPANNLEEPSNLPNQYVASDQLLVPNDSSLPVQKNYAVSQGRTLHLKIRAPSPLTNAYTTFAGTQYNFSPVEQGSDRYECFLPVDCEQAAGHYKIVVRTNSELGEKKNIACGVQVHAFPFKTQRGFKISKKKLRSMRGRGVGGGRDNKLVKQYQKKSPPYKLWQGPFAWPINVRQETSPFGEIRISHGFGKRHHYGLDLAEHHNAPIHAANHGIIANKTTTPTSGNVIAIDHGLGVFTIYCHMNSFDRNINIGDYVKKGQRIGFIGQTGYASGPHLHLEMRIKDANNQQLTAVDFKEWTQSIY